MRTAEVKGKEFSSLQEVHAYLAQALDFPDYYGKNLDALYDVLTEESIDTQITLNFGGMEEGEVKKGLRRMVKVIADASGVNDHICLVISEL